MTYYHHNKKYQHNEERLSTSTVNISAYYVKCIIICNKYTEGHHIIKIYSPFIGSISRYVDRLHRRFYRTLL